MVRGRQPGLTWVGSVRGGTGRTGGGGKGQAPSAQEESRPWPARLCTPCPGGYEGSDPNAPTARKTPGLRSASDHASQPKRAHLATTHLTGEWTALFLGPERCRDGGLLTTPCLPVTPGSLPSSVCSGGPGAGSDKALVHPSHSGRGPGGLPPGPWKATKGKSTRPAQRGARRTAATWPRAAADRRAGTSKKTGETRNLKGKVALRYLEPGPSSRDSGAQERGCLGRSWR